MKSIKFKNQIKNESDNLPTKQFVKKYKTKAELLDGLMSVSKLVLDILNQYAIEQYNEAHPNNEIGDQTQFSTNKPIEKDLKGFRNVLIRTTDFKELHDIASLNLMEVRKKVLYKENNEELVASSGANNTIYSLDKNAEIKNINDLVKNTKLLLIQRGSGAKLDFIGAIGGLVESCKATKETLNHIKNIKDIKFIINSSTFTGHPKELEKILSELDKISDLEKQKEFLAKIFDDIRIENGEVILITDRIAVAQKNATREGQEEIGELGGESLSSYEQLLALCIKSQLIVGNDPVYDDKLILNNYGIDFFREPRLVYPFCTIKESPFDRFNKFRDQYSDSQIVSKGQEVRNFIFPSLEEALKAYGIKKDGLSISSDSKYSVKAYKYRHEYAAGALGILGQVTKESGLYQTEEKRKEAIVGLMKDMQKNIGSAYTINLTQLAMDMFPYNSSKEALSVEDAMSMLDKTCLFPEGTIQSRSQKLEDQEVDVDGTLTINQIKQVGITSCIL